MLRFYRPVRAQLSAMDCGQAMVELAFAATLLLLFMCSAIDFGRAMYDLQVISELSRQGSNLASRATGTTTCDSLCTSVADLLAGDSGLGLSTNGRVIVTEFSQTKPVAGGTYTVVEQQKSATGVTATSKIAPSGSGTSTIAGAPALQTGQKLYTTEVFYSFTPATGIGALTNNAIGFPTQLYNIAYF
jgi:Flp pilus assembly protein TadG